jgi:hypothetical protein
MSAAVSPLAAMEATTPAAEIAMCSAIATIVRRPFEGLRDTTLKTRLTGGRAGAIELLRFVLSDEILNAAALGQRVFASTEGAVCVIVDAGSADRSSNFSAPLLEALTLVLVLVGMSKSSSCGALVSEGTFGVGKSVKLGAIKGHEQGEEGRNILHVCPLRLLIEVLGEFSALDAIDLHHLTLLELLRQHLDVPRLCVIHDLVVRSECFPLLGDLVGPLLELLQGRHAELGTPGKESAEHFLEGLWDIHGRLIISGQ